MAPRIRNISADELRRIFQAPQIQQPGLNVSDAIGLSSALEQRRTNQLKERQNISKIERAIAEEEARAQDVQTLATERGTAAEREAREVAREGIDPTQAGPEAGPFSQEDQAAIEQARTSAGAQFRLAGPEKVLQAEQTADIASIQSTQDFNEAIKLEKFKASLKNKTDKAKNKKGTSALIQRQESKLSNVEVISKEIAQAMELMQKAGITGAVGAAKVKLNSLTGGFIRDIPRLGKFLEVDPSIVSFEEARDSFGRRLYKDISGDVGNIAQSEGKFAKRLLPTSAETPELRQSKLDRIRRIVANSQIELKKLKKLAVAGNWSPDEYTTNVEETMNRVIRDGTATLPPAEDEESIRSFSSVQQAEEADLEPGTQITINGRQAVVE